MTKYSKEMKDGMVQEGRSCKGNLCARVCLELARPLLMGGCMADQVEPETRGPWRHGGEHGPSWHLYKQGLYLGLLAPTWTLLER